jgi:hypothetical protein
MREAIGSFLTGELLDGFEAFLILTHCEHSHTG